MKYIYLLFCLSLFSCIVKAQSAQDSVKAVINKMFAAMKDADSKSLTECFADSAILQTIVDRNDSVRVQTDEVKAFADEIATLQKNDADERITYDVVRIDGPLAIAWTPYNFYYKGQFSHCGVDSYQLVRVNGDWKIQYLVDTRRKQGCNP